MKEYYSLDVGIMKEGSKGRLYCASRGCKHFTVVTVKNSMMGTVWNKKYGYFDMRNVGYVCPKHRKSYKEFYIKCEFDKIYGMLDPWIALI
jgi:hypothetical protein